MDTNKMREQSGQQFEAFYAEYEKKREANGWMPLETHVVVHMRNAWVASREAVVVELTAEYELPPTMDMQGVVTSIRQQDIATIEAQGLRVAP